MKYIIAISGGIDSVVLLDIVMNQRLGEKIRPGDEFIVAHVDHGIREDSQDDAQLVEQLARGYDLQYVTTQLRLGANVSEATARQARYAWLENMKQVHQADAIMTAHHQDDVIETMVINMIRGTGWRGVCSLREHQGTMRPLLAMTKAEIAEYAIDHGLKWHDDSTNEDPRYLRNYVRMTIMRSMTSRARQAYIDIYTAQCRLADSIDDELRQSIMKSASSSRGLSRYFLIMSGEAVTAEIIVMNCRRRFETRSMRRVWHFVCTARPHKHLYENGFDFVVTRDELIVSSPHI